MTVTAGATVSGRILTACVAVIAGRPGNPSEALSVSTTFVPLGVVFGTFNVNCRVIVCGVGRTAGCASMPETFADRLSDFTSTSSLADALMAIVPPA